MSYFTFIFIVFCFIIAVNVFEQRAYCSMNNHITYIGAVIEYEPYRTWSLDGKGYTILRKNTKELLKYANKAKRKFADILVTPEYGLHSCEILNHWNTEDFLTFTQYVPDPSEHINPCTFQNNSTKFEAMKTLSCGIREIGIYLVVNVAEFHPCSKTLVREAPWRIVPSIRCSTIGFFVYNTQVVFDRKGTVIARYRKQHLFLEDGFTPGPIEDETALFLTDFNVTFSLQICFDIMYEHPGYNNVMRLNIKDIAMSTKWVDQLPFDLADAVQSGWSRSLAINLLVSGYHDPENYAMGSGIFRNLMQDSPIYTYNQTIKNLLIVSPVTTVVTSNRFFIRDEGNYVFPPIINRHNFKVNDVKTEEYHRFHSILIQDLSKYTKMMLKTESYNETIRACSKDNFCCSLWYSYNGTETYFLVAYSGLMSVGNGTYHLGVQQCGIIWCKTFDHLNCAQSKMAIPVTDYFGPFKLKSLNMKSNLVYPVGNSRDLQIISYSLLNFEKEITEFSVKAEHPIKNLLATALYGRWYNRDRDW